MANIAVSHVRQRGELMKVGVEDILGDDSGEVCCKHPERCSKSLEPYLGKSFSVPAEQGRGSEARAASLNEGVKSKIPSTNQITSVSFRAPRLNASGREQHKMALLKAAVALPRYSHELLAEFLVSFPPFILGNSVLNEPFLL